MSIPQRVPGIRRPSTSCASRVIVVTFGRSGSWLDDHTAAENITSSYAASNRSRIASDAFARPSQVSATSRVRRAHGRVLDQLERGELVGVLLGGGDRVRHASERTRIREEMSVLTKC